MCDNYKYGVDEAAVLGHSMGAFHAFQLALSGAIVVRQIVAVSPLAYHPEEIVAQYEPLAQAVEAGSLDLVTMLCTGWFSEPFLSANPEIRSMVGRWMDELGTEGIAAALRADFQAHDLRPRLGDVTVPVDVIVGSADAATIPDWSREIVALLPNARLKIIEGAGHFPHIEAPERTLAAALAALDHR